MKRKVYKTNEKDGCLTNGRLDLQRENNGYWTNGRFDLIETSAASGTSMRPAFAFKTFQTGTDLHFRVAGLTYILELRDGHTF